MYCKTCGSEMNENQAICLNCGCAKGSGTKYCANCGKELMPGAIACMNCGVAADFGVADEQKKTNALANNDVDGWVPAGKDKLVIILLTLFLGGIGVHNFYLGESKKGLLKILTCWFGLGGVLALIDLIKMITGSYRVDSEKYI